MESGQTYRYRICRALPSDVAVPSSDTLLAGRLDVHVQRHLLGKSR